MHELHESCHILDWDKVLESESFYLPVPSPDRTLTIESGWLCLLSVKDVNFFG